MLEARLGDGFPAEEETAGALGTSWALVDSISFLPYHLGSLPSPRDQDKEADEPRQPQTVADSYRRLSPSPGPPGSGASKTALSSS